MSASQTAVQSAASTDPVANFVMGTTAKDLAKTIKVAKPLTWAERRAQYVPNTDAAGLGYGTRHRDYGRYMSPWQAQNVAAAAALKKEAANTAAPTTTLTTSTPTATVTAAVASPVVGIPAVAKPSATTTNNNRFGHASVVPKKLQAPGPMTMAEGVTVGSVAKPTQLDAGGRIIKDAAGLGYYITHPSHAWYTAAKRPEDCKPLATTLNLNDW